MSDKIQELAYLKWEAAGANPYISDEERNRFWFEAEQEYANSMTEKQEIKAISPKKRSSRKKEK